MIQATTFKGQTIAVFGLGRTGITAAKSLAAGGATVLAWDDSQDSVGRAQERGIPIADLRDADWTKIDELVLSPGVPDTLPSPHWVALKARQNNVPIICDIEIFAREVASRAPENRPKIIAVTGTNGKSTTTTLIGHILQTCGKDAQVGGNIGRGVLDLERMHRGTYYVLELSSYQLERTSSLRANAAVFLNLSPDHLDRHGDMKGYEAAKRRIFLNQNASDAIIIGVDNEDGRRICTELTATSGKRVIPISGRKSLARGISVIKGTLYSSIGTTVEQAVDLRRASNLEGAHNWQNAAAAFAAVRAMGLNADAIGKGIISFPGLAHRMETVGRMGPLRFVNDSKATNADAAAQALGSYDNIFWIAGGQAKADGIAPLQPYFKNIRKAYLIGASAQSFRDVLNNHRVENKISGKMKLAILCAVKDALQSGVKDPIILLSPACASFDQFKNFEVRGDAFRDEVTALMDIFAREKVNYRMHGDAA